MAKKKFFVAGEELIVINKIIWDIQRQLYLKNGSSLDPKEVKRVLQQINEGAASQIIVGKVEKLKNSILTLISGNSSLILDALDGKDLLSEAKDTFGYIDPDFKNYGANSRGKATKEAPVSIYEMAKDATFKDVFGSFSQDLRNLCLTQSQIKNFVIKHRNWLRTDGWATFFLFESNEHLFAARVRVVSRGDLKVNVRRFEYSDVWSAGNHHRVVVPQLAL